MNFSTDRVATAEAAAAPHAAAYDQLQRTVLRLVQAALDDAWRSGRTGDAIDHLPRALPAPVSAPRRDAALSRREREVLQRIAAGDSNKLVVSGFFLRTYDR